MQHVVGLRDGNILTGEIIEKKFSIKTSHGESEFSIDQIVHIRFGNPPQSQRDEILMLTGETLNGIVSPHAIGLMPQGSSQVIELEKQDVHMIELIDNC